MDISYNLISFISKYLYFKKVFAEIIEIVTIFIKANFKDSKKLKSKELEVKYQHATKSVFLDIVQFADFRQKILMLPELKGCVTWFVFWIFFR